MIFQPTGTSQALINAVRPHLKDQATLLDLGCGCGMVGHSLATQGVSVYASDISQEAIDKVNKFIIRARCGYLFEPWRGMKFDYIVDDVSGISEDVAKISPWFNGVSCATGKDGTDLIAQVLRQAPDYLEPNGKLFFPIVSFSDIEKTIKIAEENFKIERLSHNEFPLPKEMYKHKELLTKLKNEGCIQFKEKFGMIIFWTDIYKGETWKK